MIIEILKVAFKIEAQRCNCQSPTISVFIIRTVTKKKRHIIVEIRSLYRQKSGGLYQKRHACIPQGVQALSPYNNLKRSREGLLIKSPHVSGLLSIYNTLINTDVERIVP